MFHAIVGHNSAQQSYRVFNILISYQLALVNTFNANSAFALRNQAFGWVPVVVTGNVTRYNLQTQHELRATRTLFVFELHATSFI